MLDKPSRRQLLKTSSSVDFKRRAAVTSLPRHICFRTRRVLSVRTASVVISAIFLTACVASSSGVPLFTQVAMRGPRDVGRGRSAVDLETCKNCQRIREQLMSLLTANDRSVVISASAQKSLKLPQVFAKKLRQLCDRLTYQKCRSLKQMYRKAEDTLHETTGKIDPSDSRTSLSNQQINPELYNALLSNRDHDDQSTSYSTVKSRSKRFASGDRRLMYVISKTHYVLEIGEDGSVRGSPEKTSNGVLEVQTVDRNGIVRFYSPATGYFLAMNEEGRLYGSKMYSEDNCDFVERLQENHYNTYSSASLPRSKKGKGRKRHRRSIARNSWYIGIGKWGQPRKASRISAHHSAALFLALPLKN